MEVKIGVTQSPKEIELEMEGDDVESLAKLFDDAVKSESPIVWVVDNKGRKVGIPATKVAYVEIAKSDNGRKVGFSV
ncbi:MAG: DUF3107 domain-containing protein [Acidimicrobiia bacterium]